MNVGMLWFDNDPKKELDDKIERAATYYSEKYGKKPTICFIHPSMMPDSSTRSPDNDASVEVEVQDVQLQIRSNQSVLPNHFWIGVNGFKSSVTGS